MAAIALAADVGHEEGLFAGASFGNVGREGHDVGFFGFVPAFFQRVDRGLFEVLAEDYLGILVDAAIAGVF